MPDDPTPDPAATPPAPAPAPGGAKPPVTDPKADPDALGPAGEKALAEERAARKIAEKAAKDSAAELDKLRKESMSETEKAIATARDEARKEAIGGMAAKLLRSDIRAAAGAKLADPDDAVAHLSMAGDLNRFLSDDGEVDNKAVASAIDDLLKAKPYLAAQAKPGALPGGGAKPANGSSGSDWLREQFAAKR